MGLQYLLIWAPETFNAGFSLWRWFLVPKPWLVHSKHNVQISFHCACLQDLWLPLLWDILFLFVCFSFMIYFSSQLLSLLSKIKNTNQAVLLIQRPLDAWYDSGTLGAAIIVTLMISQFQKVLNLNMGSWWIGPSYFLLGLWIRCCLSLQPSQYDFDSKEPMF